ncbi:MAG TPA: MFS transporter [Bryobacteraceae bacterium]|jgi:ACS family glucarate transporter-like MFS transporter|nr:MFS transporter [Bryobacteraceae bacterium]
MLVQSPHQRQVPTRVRYWVVVFAVTLAVVTYIDRVCISFAAGFIRADLHLSTVQMGYAFSAFAWAYALFEIPGGFLGDWMGARRVLLRIVLWWSFFTAATGWTWNFVSLAVTRSLFGAGEAGCFPNLTKTFTTWLPHHERVRAQGIMWLSARWGGAFTPPLVYLAIQVMSWRHAFELFGCIGVVWAIVFYAWYRDHPRDNPNLNDAERLLLAPNEALAAGHTRVPWRKFARSPQVWLLCAQYFCSSYGWYFYITWLPTYLKEARGLDLGASAIFGILPLFLGGLGSLVSGFIAAPLTRLTGSVLKTRRLLAYLGFSGASLMLVVSTRMHNPVPAMIAMGLASFSNDLVMPGSWGACMDVGGKYAGTLSGAMNMMGNLGGAASPTIIGHMLRWTGNNWDMTFYVSAAVYAVAVFLWRFLDPVTPLECHD